jgi:hypothetical protein
MNIDFVPVEHKVLITVTLRLAGIIGFSIKEARVDKHLMPRQSVIPQAIRESKINLYTTYGQNLLIGAQFESA